MLMHSTFTGARHLWFVSTILICYVITPILESFFRRANKKQYIATTIIAVEIATLFFYGFADFYNGAWISCYILGYSLGVNERDQFFTKRVMMIIFGVLAAMNIPQIYVDYIRIASFSGSIKNLYNILCDYNHVWLGIFLFLTMKSIFDRIEPAIAVKKCLDIADKYSYEAYLVHHFLILGSFSLMGLTPKFAANIFIVLIGIAVLSWLVKRIEIIIMKVLP